LVNLNNRLRHNEVHVTSGRGDSFGCRRSRKGINGSGVAGLGVKQLALHRSNLHLTGIGHDQGANSQDGQSEEDDGNRYG
jgi:hypothetical protein